MLPRTDPSAATGTATGSPFKALGSSSAISRRTDLMLLTLFWAYVAGTNILWGTSMQASLASIGIGHVFASSHVRLVQHLILYPALLAAMWISRRIAWQPLARAIPLQLLCGILFAALGGPAMDVAEATTGMYPWQAIHLPPLWSRGGQPLGADSFLWIASFVMVLINYAFALALLSGFEFYRRYRDGEVRAEALERSLGAAHLAALRMQLSPHTLFNLLHTIRGQVAWDPAAAQSMIVQLGDLLRRALRAGEQDLSRLEEEVEFVQLYLQLQQRRFTDRLTVSVPSPDTLPAVWVPSLILQPLVENAVVHGLAQPQPQVTVRLEVDVDGEALVLRVINSMPPNGVVTVFEQPGIGLKNVRERLAIQFEGQATCRSGRTPNNEWLAELRLPMLHSSAPPP